jgi:hypothetical protein
VKKYRKSLFSSLHATDQAVDFLVEFGIFVTHLFDLSDAVDNRRMMFSTEFFSDLRQRGLG